MTVYGSVRPPPPPPDKTSIIYTNNLNQDVQIFSDGKLVGTLKPGQTQTFPATNEQSFVAKSGGITIRKSVATKPSDVQPIILNQNVLVETATSGSNAAVGGRGGANFDVSTSISGDITEARLVEIRVRSGKQIDALQFVYRSRTGTITTPRYGGSGGSESIFKLAPGEFILVIEGRSGSSVDQLQFFTNLGRVSPVYGGRGGSPFAWWGVQAFGLTGFGWFTGRSGRLVDSLQPHFVDNLETKAVGTSRNAVGGRGGAPFDFFHFVDDILAAKLVGVRVRAARLIDAIQLVYSYGGQTLTTPLYGGRGGTEHVFTLNPGEIIVKIEGRSGTQIDQLRFVTNTGRKSPVYGGNGGSPFTWTSDPEFSSGGLCWFSGRSASVVDQLQPHFVLYPRAYYAE